MYIFTKTLDTHQEKSVLLEDMLMGEENLYGKKIIQNVTTSSNLDRFVFLGKEINKGFQNTN